MDEEKEEEIELTYNQDHKEEQKESEEEWVKWSDIQS